MVRVPTLSGAGDPTRKPMSHIDCHKLSTGQLKDCETTWLMLLRDGTRCPE